MAVCLVFNVRGKLIFFTSLGGAIGWFVYLLCRPLQNDIVQFFIATVVITIYSEVMARIHKVPVTGYLLIALLPMVPGGGIYYTMEYCIAGNTQMFLETRPAHPGYCGGASARHFAGLFAQPAFWNATAEQE